MRERESFGQDAGPRAAGKKDPARSAQSSAPPWGPHHDPADAKTLPTVIVIVCKITLPLFQAIPHHFTLHPHPAGRDLKTPKTGGVPT